LISLTVLKMTKVAQITSAAISVQRNTVYTTWLPHRAGDQRDCIGSKGKDGDQTQQRETGIDRSTSDGG
jgi:hypothetical protein